MHKLSAAVAALVLAVNSAQAADLDRVERVEKGGAGVKIGILTCGIQSGVGFIVVSHKGLECVFSPSHGGPIERYSGSITRIGLDLGVTDQSTVVWVVIAPGKIGRGALAGHYGGASAEATALVGWGANVLVGGSLQTIALQPVSLQAQTGFDIAAGIAGLHLEYTGGP